MNWWFITILTMIIRYVKMLTALASVINLAAVSVERWQILHNWGLKKWCPILWWCGVVLEDLQLLLFVFKVWPPTCSWVNSTVSETLPSQQLEHRRIRTVWTLSHLFKNKSKTCRNNFLNLPRGCNCVKINSLRWSPVWTFLMTSFFSWILGMVMDDGQDPVAPAWVSKFLRV